MKCNDKGCIFFNLNLVFNCVWHKYMTRILFKLAVVFCNKKKKDLYHDAAVMSWGEMAMLFVTNGDSFQASNAIKV